MIINIVLHSIVTTLGFYLFCVFMIWWKRDLNTLYKYTCFTWLGVAVTNAGAVWVYVAKYMAGDEDLFQFVPEWWVWRHLLAIIPLFLYAWYVTKKIYIIRTKDHPRRRNGDFR